MIGTLEYTRCSPNPFGFFHVCPNHCACVDKILTMPQCFSCWHWRQVDCRCSIHGKLPDPRGCCGLYIKSPLEYCIKGWAHKREWGLDCGWVDTIGCEACIAEDERMRGEEG